MVLALCGAAHTSGSISRLPNQAPLPISEAFEEALEQKAFGVLGLVSCFQDDCMGSAHTWVSLGPSGHSQGLAEDKPSFLTS